MRPRSNSRRRFLGVCVSRRSIERRLENFKANRRGFWSFWVFLALFVLSLCSNIIANDRPILAFYKGELLFPIFVNYPEEKFGGFLRAYGLSRSDDRQGDRRAWLDAVAADPLFLRHAQSRSADAGALAADLASHQGAMRSRRGQGDPAGRAQSRLSRHRMELARHRRPGPRRRRAPALRLPPLGAVWPDAGLGLLGDRRRRGRHAGLFRRHGRSHLRSASSKSGRRCRSFIC